MKNKLSLISIVSVGFLTTILIVVFLHQVYKIHSDLEYKMNRAERVTHEEVIGLKKYTVRKDMNIEKEFRNIDVKLEKEIIDIAENIKNFQNRVDTILDKLDSIEVSLERRYKKSIVRIESENAKTNEQVLAVLKQFDIEIEEFENKIYENVDQIDAEFATSLDSLWNFLQKNGNWKMRRKLLKENKKK
tara:strand:+ start:557 stop:1123 length:567 start_codon:yes stop_codon:yes gene_type:complete